MAKYKLERIRRSMNINNSFRFAKRRLEVKGKERSGRKEMYYRISSVRKVSINPESKLT